MEGPLPPNANEYLLLCFLRERERERERERDMFEKRWKYFFKLYRDKSVYEVSSIF